MAQFQQGGNKEQLSAVIRVWLSVLGTSHGRERCGVDTPQEEEQNF